MKRNVARLIVVVAAVLAAVMLSSCAFVDSVVSTVKDIADTAKLAQRFGAASQLVSREEVSSAQELPVPVGEAAAPQPIGAPEGFNALDPSQYYCYSWLSDTQRQAYDYILSACMTMYKGEFCVGRISTRDAMIAYRAMRSDWPQIFWLGNGCTCSDRGGLAYLSFSDAENGYTVETASKRDEMYAELTERIRQAWEECKLERSMSDYQCELLLHDWLCRHMRYEEADHAFDSYGAFVGKRGVCEAYSRALQLLLYSVGIQNTLVCGDVFDNGSDESGGHMWNSVLIDGEWYGVDATWNDERNNGIMTMHIYFNITDEDMVSDRSLFVNVTGADLQDVLKGQYNINAPICRGRRFNYYVMNNTWIENEKDFDEVIVAGIENAMPAIKAVEYRCGWKEAPTGKKLEKKIRSSDALKRLLKRYAYSGYKSIKWSVKDDMSVFVLQII